MFEELIQMAIALTVNSIKTLTIEDNHEEIERKIEKLSKVFEQDSLTQLMKSAGKELKKQVLNKGNWASSYDLSDYGQLLNYLANEEPTVIYDTKTSKVVLGFGNIANLNQIKRSADTGLIRLSRDGQVREINLKAGDFPYWIAAEFGILARGEDPPGYLGLPPRKSTTKYSPLKLDSLKPSGKPHFIMVKSKVRPPHPGVYPTRLFRRGLNVVRQKQFIEKKLDALVKKALQS
jgi:hypothetical protein